jgi:hypothetical protein
MNVGQLAFIKTTGEQVLIATHPTQGELRPSDLSGTGVGIYRPVAGQDGIRHQFEVCPIELLETAEARFNREYEEFSELQAKARINKAETQLKLPATDVPTLN